MGTNIAPPSSESEWTSCAGRQRSHVLLAYGVFSALTDCSWTTIPLPDIEAHVIRRKRHGPMPVTAANTAGCREAEGLSRVTSIDQDAPRSPSASAQRNHHDPCASQIVSGPKPETVAMRSTLHLHQHLIAGRRLRWSPDCHDWCGTTRCVSTTQTTTSRRTYEGQMRGLY